MFKLKQYSPFAKLIIFIIALHLKRLQLNLNISQFWQSVIRLFTTTSLKQKLQTVLWLRCCAFSNKQRRLVHWCKFD